MDDLSNTDNKCFDGLISKIYPSEVQLNRANSFETEARFLDLHLSILDGFILCKFYNKCDDFDFEIVNFPFLDGDVPRVNFPFLDGDVPRPASTVFISRNLFGSSEYQVMFLTSTLEINC